MDRERSTIPGISVPFENSTVCVITSPSSKQRDYISTQNACFQTELKSPVWLTLTCCVLRIQVAMHDRCFAGEVGIHKSADDRHTYSSSRLGERH